MTEPHADTIHSVDITCNIISALKESHGMGVTELATELGHSKSTIHRHLSTLEKNRYVVNEDGTYRLSLRFLNVAVNVREQFRNYGIVEQELDNLAEKTEEVAQFGIEEHGQVTYLYKTTGTHGVPTASRVGSQQPMHSTSLGKAILAHLPNQKVDNILDLHGLPKRTAKTTTDRDELFEELNRIRQRGFSFDDEENVTGLRCIGAPVLYEDNVIGAVSISGPSSRLEGELFREELPREVMRTANVIELNSKFAE